MTQKDLDKWLDKRFQEISDATGFDSGDEFKSDQHVREYFTVENMVNMFGVHDTYRDLPCDWHQDELDKMANDVIQNGWHMAGRDEE